MIRQNACVSWLDEALLAHETLNFHPLRNDMTTSISRADFLGFAEATGHTVTRIDFTKLGAGLRNVAVSGASAHLVVQPGPDAGPPDFQERFRGHHRRRRRTPPRWRAQEPARH